ncbi:MAG: transglycosylase SLT domain-containing protein [Chromatiales bacterium]|nr:transglycosylase SLT domain-containing protein [Chromatiales bacterium]
MQTNRLGGFRTTVKRQHQKFMKSFSALLGALLISIGANGQANDGHAERVLFLETKKALEQGNYEVFGRNIQQLKDYPLYPYLIYWKLRDRLGEQPPATIEAFLTSYDTLPIASHLRGAWLKRLADEKRWPEFLHFYRGGSTVMQCRLHTAQLHTGDKKSAWAGAEKLWLSGKSQPDACDDLFQAWERGGGITPALRWQRVELAMHQGNTSLARHLAKGLSGDDRETVTLWRRVYNDPTLIERSDQIKKDSARHRHIVAHGLQRLARRDAARAAKLWNKVSGKYRFSTAQNNEINRAIARNFAYDGDSRGLIWYAQITPESVTQHDRTWATRLALRQSNWRAARTWIESMPVTERQSVDWQYWQARINEQLGEQQQAEHLYHTVSGDRGYYGFLAADQIDGEYNLDHQPVDVDPAAIKALKQTPGMVRAHELYMLLLTKEARLEWESAVARMNKEEILVAGKLADEWKWYDTALLTLAKARYFSDLDIRFPLAHSGTVTREAETRDLDPSWVYAVARQESAMMPDARSPAGAMGLMQLMPSTGKAVAKRLNYPISDTEQLLVPDINIRLGAAYLRQVLDRFNNPVLATAAYNAGPHRVDKWFPEDGHVDADIWIENMPFNETRKYVRRVMAYSVFYDQRLDKPITRLQERMPAVGHINNAL